MPTEPFHGARVFQSLDDPVYVSFGPTAVIGMLCAIAASDLPAGMAFNQPIHIQTPVDGAALPAEVREELDSVFDQVTAPIILVLVDEGADLTAATAAAVGDQTQRTGVHAWTRAASLGMPIPKLLVAPGLTGPSAANGIRTIAVGAGGTGYTSAPTVAIAGSTGGTGAQAVATVSGGVVTGIEIVKPGSGYTGVLSVTLTGGGGAGAAATATAGTVMNAVIAEAIGVAETLRAVVFADGPDTNAAAAVAARQLIGHRRVIYSDPSVLKSVGGVPVARPSSTIFAAIQAKMDKLAGPHWSFDNQLINGIQGSNRPIDGRTEANYLTLNGVNTIVNWGDGFRTWGSKTCAVGTVWEFASVVRVADMVNESLEVALRQFIGRPQSKMAYDQMAMAGRAALKLLENAQILLPGSRFGLSSAMTPAEGAQGIVKFGSVSEPPAPIFDLRVVSYRNTEIAYQLLFDSVSGRIDTGTVA